MKRSGEDVAWLCIFSILLMSCYTSTMIEPAREDRNVARWKMSSNDIKSVWVRDGTEYRFEKTPTVENDSIFGEAQIRVTEGTMTKQVSIPLCDVTELSVKEFSWTWTTVAVLTGVTILAGEFLTRGGTSKF